MLQSMSLLQFRISLLPLRFNANPMPSQTARAAYSHGPKLPGTLGISLSNNKATPTEAPRTAMAISFWRPSFSPRRLQRTKETQVTAHPKAEHMEPTSVTGIRMELPSRDAKIVMAPQNKTAFFGVW